MRWSLWCVLIGLLVASLTRTPPVATAFATGLLTAGCGVRLRHLARLPRGHGAGGVRGEPVVLERHEERRLREIEERWEAEDPGFVERFRRLSRPGAADEPDDPRPRAV